MTEHNLNQIEKCSPRNLLWCIQGVRQARVSDMHLPRVVLETVSGSFSQSVPEAFLKRIPEAFLKRT